MQIKKRSCEGMFCSTNTDEAIEHFRKQNDETDFSKEGLTISNSEFSSIVRSCIEHPSMELGFLVITTVCFLRLDTHMPSSR